MNNMPCQNVIPGLIICDMQIYGFWKPFRFVVNIFSIFCEPKKNLKLFFRYRAITLLVPSKAEKNRSNSEKVMLIFWGHFLLPSHGTDWLWNMFDEFLQSYHSQTPLGSYPSRPGARIRGFHTITGSHNHWCEDPWISHNPSGILAPNSIFL